LKSNYQEREFGRACADDPSRLQLIAIELEIRTMEYVLLALAVIASAVGISSSLLHVRLMAEFNFTMLSRPFVFFFVVLLIVPTLVHLAYVTPCRNLDHFPVMWTGYSDSDGDSTGQI
jgi:hypothetical protein